MWGRSILTVLYLIVGVTLAVPANYDSSASDENGLVYVFNIYAVRNTKTGAVGKQLSDEAMFKVPANFEAIGSVLLADTEDDEPFTMAEFAEFLEDMGVSVEKLNEEEDPRIIEVSIDTSLEDLDYFEDLVRALQVEGIILDVSEEDGKRVLRVEFDEVKKHAEDQPFALAELGDFLEKEGFTVEYVEAHGIVKAIKITFDEDDDDEPKQSPEPTPRTTLEQKPERDENKIEKNDKKKKVDDREQFAALDFTTKSEALNKIRRRREASSCPECKAAGIVRSFVNRKK